MADHTPYQKGVIRRFYENRDSIAIQKLGEIVSSLYLETSETKLTRMWKSAHAQMLAAGVHEHYAQSILDERDLGELAKVISDLT